MLERRVWIMVYRYLSSPFHFLTWVSSMQSLPIVVVNPVAIEGDDDPSFEAQAARGKALRIGMLQTGYNISASLPADLYLPRRIAQLQPDMIIIDAESDARDALEHVVVASRDARRPTVLFTEDEKTSSMDAAMAACVSAYIVAGLHAARQRLADGASQVERAKGPPKAAAAGDGQEPQIVRGGATHYRCCRFARLMLFQYGPSRSTDGRAHKKRTSLVRRTRKVQFPTARASIRLKKTWHAVCIFIYKRQRWSCWNRLTAIFFTSDKGVFPHDVFILE